MRTNPEHFAVFISLLEIPDQACCVVVLQHMKCIEPNYRIQLVYLFKDLLNPVSLSACSSFPACTVILA